MYGCMHGPMDAWVIRWMDGLMNSWISWFVKPCISTYKMSLSVWKNNIQTFSLLFLLDVEMLQASTSNPIPRDGFSRTTKDSMIRKFLEGKLQQWAGKQKEGKRNKCKLLPGSLWGLLHWRNGLPCTCHMVCLKALYSHELPHQPITSKPEVPTTGATALVKQVAFSQISF